ncbi:hypothetical protein Tco_0347761 [Tanacetum coccineum]
MVVAAMKHMATNFAKLDKCLILNGMSDPLFDIYQNVESSKELWDSLEAKYMVEDASSKKFLVSNFTNYKMTDSRPIMEQYNELLDFKHTLKHQKEELTLVALGSHMRIEESLWVQDNDKPKGNNVAGPSVVNMMQHNNSFTCNDKKGGKVGNKANGSGINGSVDGSTNSPKDDDVAWWVDSGATMHVCKDRCWFKIYESMNDGSILYMVNELTALVHRRGCVDLRFSSGKIVSLLSVLHVYNIRKNLVSSSVLNNYGYKEVIESNKFVSSKHGMFIGFGYLSNKMHAKLGHVHYKKMQDMSKDGLILAIDTDIEKCKTYMLIKITKKLFQNVKRETEVLELIHSDLCDLHATPSLGNKKYFMTFIDDASREVVRFPDPKLKTLGERGIECIFVGYAEHSKAFRYYVIGPNESVSINSIIESRDAIFDGDRFSSVPRPSLRIPNGTEDIGGSVVPEEVIEEVTKEVVQQPEPDTRKSKRNRNPKNFGHKFQLYLIEETRDEVSD